MCDWKQHTVKSVELHVTVLQACFGIKELIQILPEYSIKNMNPVLNGPECPLHAGVYVRLFGLTTYRKFQMRTFKYFTKIDKTSCSMCRPGSKTTEFEVHVVI